ncbi:MULTISPECIES: superoxide dismutase family protein [Virgibacillus]|uniref:Superoxide dismutase family protein n=1 Tax=Virgibacillus dokdonensis TaxID=302167 RepID=A0A2K9J1R8_9BACI|nr:MULTISPECIES: superoxide dismutase family protein [Virgibacillus]AUJ25898.1 Superoxide dismutase-like protein YojM precursor [Virgibacillus dokdonensis]NWO13349.1 superoxide dismutase family protein [Virgibacillus sp.]
MRMVMVISLLLIAVACQPKDEKTKEVEMYNSSGDMVGTASFHEQSDGVKVKVELEGLEPGFHGIHVHEYAKCEAPDFTSAGNHFNPTGAEHGLMHPEGNHLGDMPNIEADANGVINAELMMPETTLLDGKNSLIKGEGTSVIVTKNKDDGVSQPGGDSGERIICGTLTKTNGDNEKQPSDPTQNNEDEK